MELLGKPGLASEQIKIVQSLIDSCILVKFNHEIKSVVIQIGRNFKLKLPDAIMAATLKYLRSPLYKDFKKVPNLELLFIE